MTGTRARCDGSCYLDFDDEDDDRSWSEWFYDVAFNATMWGLIASIALALLSAGVWVTLFLSFRIIILWEQLQITMAGR